MCPGPSPPARLPERRPAPGTEGGGVKETGRMHWGLRGRVPKTQVFKLSGQGTEKSRGLRGGDAQQAHSESRRVYREKACTCVRAAPTPTGRNHTELSWPQLQSAKRNTGFGKEPSGRSRVVVTAGNAAAECTACVAEQRIYLRQAPAPRL